MRNKYRLREDALRRTGGSEIALFINVKIDSALRRTGGSETIPDGFWSSKKALRRTGGSESGQYRDWRTG